MKIGKVFPIFFVFTLAACVKNFNIEMAQVKAKCEPPLFNNFTHIENQTEVAACYNRKEKPIFEKYHPEFLSFYDDFSTQRAAISLKLDNHEITAAEYKEQMDIARKQFSNSIINEVKAKQAAQQVEQIAQQEAFNENMRKQQAESERKRKLEEKREQAEAKRIKRDQLAADKATCHDYGIPRGTREFSGCLIQLDQARQQHLQQQQAQMLQQQQAEQQQQAAKSTQTNPDSGGCSFIQDLALAACLKMSGPQSLQCQVNILNNCN